ncbi:MAG: HNH endonuclease [bacterium]|nr:HNH endonuclease [bacterium]
MVGANSDILSQSVLVLNAGMIPIEICTVRKAVLDIFRKAAIAVHDGEGRLRSPSISLPIPSIIARVTYNKIPRRDIALNKWNILHRDGYTCAYCRKQYPPADLTIDHIIPRSRWNKLNGDRPNFSFNSWRNVTTACRKCNATKGSHLLSEIGWKLQTAPERPKWLPQLVISRQRAEQLGWLDYCQYNVKLMEQVEAVEG